MRQRSRRSAATPHRGHYCRDSLSGPARLYNCSVAFPITRSALLLQAAADPERELDQGLFPPVTRPLFRGSGTVRRDCARGPGCPISAVHGGAGNVEVVTPSLRRRSCSVALRWCSSALATICMTANAGVDHVGATGGGDHVGGDIRAIRDCRRVRCDACAVTGAGLGRGSTPE